ncbi:ArsR/SmtB family transcription factor [Streptomyces sp. NPDC006703]|uniref:ArsR/SmtB family transcription factor n=1 Tax=Streptomyces sp. NPDC006703 TaxID=3364759 RepID=UPI0036A2E3D2
MLTQLHPDLAWQNEGTLQFANPEWELTFNLGGQGLALRPNHFLHHPTAILTDLRPPVLMYPASNRPTHNTDGLTGLVGPARARALRAIAQEPCTTRQLAEHLGVSPPTASAHASALRNAGAITTERQGRQVQHSLTPLGHHLLNG